MYSFEAKIYKVGINAVADVPEPITDRLIKTKGYIRIKGTINKYPFTTTLVPVKERPYRLYTNIPMLKGGNAAIGDVVNFEIEQNHDLPEHDYPMNQKLLKRLETENLLDTFNALTQSRRKDICKYLGSLKSGTALEKNIEKVIVQLSNGKNARIP